MADSTGINNDVLSIQLANRFKTSLNNQRRSDQTGRNGSSSRIDKTRLKCSHCGMSRHTKEQCFKIVGFPEWWNDSHKKGGKDGKVAVAVGGSEASGSGSGDDHQKSSGGAYGFGGIAAGTKCEEEGTTGHQDGNDYWTWH